jgi:hypothetical protein
MISTFNCAPETRSKHARPVCVFHDMLWSRVSSCGLLALEEVVEVPSLSVFFSFFIIIFPLKKDRKDSLRCCLLVEVDYLHYE